MRFCANSEAWRRGLNRNTLADDSCLSQLLKAQTLPTVDVAEADRLFTGLSTEPIWEENFRRKIVQDDTDNMSDDERLLRDFLFVACVKDCSIILSFGRGDGLGGPLLRVIKVIDLDPKPVSRIPHYLKLDKAIRWVHDQTLMVERS